MGGKRKNEQVSGGPGKCQAKPRKEPPHVNFDFFPRFFWLRAFIASEGLSRQVPLVVSFL